MNSVKYADFKSIYVIDGFKVVRKNKYADIFAGMYTLIVLVKEGFAGIEEITKLAEEDYLASLKSEVKRVLRETEQ